MFFWFSFSQNYGLRRVMMDWPSLRHFLFVFPFILFFCGNTLQILTPIKANIPISFVAHLGLARQYLKMFNCDKQIAKQM